MDSASRAAASLFKKRIVRMIFLMYEQILKTKEFEKRKSYNVKHQFERFESVIHKFARV